MRINRRLGNFSSVLAGCALAAAFAVSTGCDSQNRAVSPTAPVSLSADATAAKPPADTPVTAVVADSRNGYPLRVQSDGAGSYTNTAPTLSIIKNGGAEWDLFTYQIARRA